MKKLRGKSSAESDEISLEKTLILVRKLIDKIEGHLDLTASKGSIADYIRILQLQKELEDKRFRRIEVKWVDDV